MWRFHAAVTVWVGPQSSHHLVEEKQQKMNDCSRITDVKVEMTDGSMAFFPSDDILIMNHISHDNRLVEM